MFVATFAGAWIEIWQEKNICVAIEQVAPFAGAWIEIVYMSFPFLLYMGRTLRGCVD